MPVEDAVISTVLSQVSKRILEKLEEGKELGVEDILLLYMDLMYNELREIRSETKEILAGLSSLEARVAGLEERVGWLERRVERLEERIDRLYEAIRGGAGTRGAGQA